MTIETKLFSWTGGWDNADTAAFQFYDCTLKVQVGDYLPGTFVPTILLDYEKSKLVLYFSEDNEEGYALSLQVGERL
jgi:hypothetical protein